MNIFKQNWKYFYDFLGGKEEKKDSKKKEKTPPAKEKSPPSIAGPCPPVPAETGGWSAKAIQLNEDIALQGDKVSSNLFGTSL